MSKHGRNIIFKRGYFVGFFMTLMFIALMVRIYFIQILEGEEYKEQVAKQHILNLEESLPRGNIFDRNGVKITNQYKEKTAFIFKRNIEGDVEKKEELKRHLNYSDKEFELLLKRSDSMIEVALDRKVNIKELTNMKDVIIIDKYKR